MAICRPADDVTANMLKWRQIAGSNGYDTINWVKWKKWSLDHSTKNNFSVIHSMQCSPIQRRDGTDRRRRQVVRSLNSGPNWSIFSNAFSIIVFGIFNFDLPELLVFCRLLP